MLVEILNHTALLSVAILLIAALIKFLISVLARKTRSRKQRENKHISQSIRHVINLVSVLLLLLIWSAEIQNFALSIAAFAVAIVLAMREFIQSIIGFLYLISTRPFREGDWIQIDGDYGEVAEIDWVKTRLLEIDMKTYQITRRTISVPNSKLVISTIKNLNFIKRYVTHSFTIVKTENYNGFPLYDELLNRANLYCEEFSEVAARYNSIIERKLDAVISGPEPEIRFSTTDIGDFRVRITLFCPTELALSLEHKLTSDFMKMWYELKIKTDLENKAGQG
ncbi:MscS mechanosensitive ion channel [Glaciecola punicea ACAM 611]|uniref:MscS mechanosensitive ion channel n=1 Tax=Glaciecola punicea ACAM 611 TaxID=1121923 RepID=H5T7K8_9ALTE|nr:mechanosensitive ion channel family protein [Glaciecola punicea]GAB54285.1 MscS mechanosensitive ion channel [Glaciecola punicea ACAM 611]